MCPYVAAVSFLLGALCYQSSAGPPPKDFLVSTLQQGSKSWTLEGQVQNTDIHQGQACCFQPSPAECGC